MQVFNGCNVAKPVQQPKTDKSLVCKIYSFFQKFFEFKENPEANKPSVQRSLKTRARPIFDDDCITYTRSNYDFFVQMFKP